MAYYQGEEAELYIERDDGQKDKESIHRYFSGYEDWPEYEKKALEHAEGRILDLGCGPGRHALWLQEKGFEIVAVDISPLALEVAQRRGVSDCRMYDANDLDFPESSFDTILLLGTNLGIAGDIPSTRKMLQTLHRITTPRGVIIGTSFDPLNTSNPIHLAYHEKNRKRGRPPGLVRLRTCYKDECDDWFEFLFLSLDELSEVIAPTGWKIEKVYPSGKSHYGVILSKKPYPSCSRTQEQARHRPNRHITRPSNAR